MPTQKLSDAFLRSVKLPEQAQISYFHTLTRGCALVATIGRAGTKTLSVMTYVHGKPKIAKLGTYPQMSLKDARAKALAVHANPKQFEEERRKAREPVDSFEAIARNFIRQYIEPRQLRTEKEIIRAYERYLFPYWGKRPLAEIKRSLVVKRLDEIAADNGPVMADQVLAHLNTFFKWVQVRDEEFANPIPPGIISHLKHGAAQSRERTLSDDEIRAIWALEEDQFTIMVKVLLHLAQRQSKVTQMMWSDIEDGVWTVRTEPREKGNPGSIRLPKAVRDLLDRLPRLVGNQHVFPAVNGTGPFASHAIRKHQLDDKLKPTTNWTLHDLRRTARSLMARAGVRPDIAERTLGHVIRGVEGIYDRHKYEVEVGQALNQLAALIENIVSPSPKNVVQLRRK